MLCKLLQLQSSHIFGEVTNKRTLQRFGDLNNNALNANLFSLQILFLLYLYLYMQMLSCQLHIQTSIIFF